MKIEPNEELTSSINLFTEIIMLSYEAELSVAKPRTLESLIKFYEEDFKDYSIKNPQILPKDIIELTPYIFSMVYNNIICAIIEKGTKLL
jgi:hypothetical protein